jgi:hypothetical protein
LSCWDLAPQVYYRYATTEEIKEMMLWAYPVKEEKKVEVKTLSEDQKAEIKVGTYKALLPIK